MQALPIRIEAVLVLAFGDMVLLKLTLKLEMYPRKVLLRETIQFIHIMTLGRVQLITQFQYILLMLIVNIMAMITMVDIGGIIHMLEILTAQVK